MYYDAKVIHYFHDCNFIRALRVWLMVLVVDGLTSPKPYTFSLISCRDLLTLAQATVKSAAQLSILFTPLEA
ncbi:MAG: hypothetical protein HNEKOMLI_00897 [Sodalis sp. Psp]|nr:hypothetical protein [Sodalis sp. Psp]MCR3757356.1 hypothetical protein [Sodalis sp. Ppy]